MPKIRNIIIFSTIAIIFILIYVFFIRSSEDDTPALVTTSPTSSDGTSLPTTGDTSVANDFLTLLLSVKNIKLEASIFEDEAFKSLRDSSIVLIPDGTEGRPNPFAPIGRDVLPPSVNTSSSTTPRENPSTNSSSAPINTPPPVAR